MMPLLIAALDCAEFEARAYVLDAIWEQSNHHEEALLLLSMYPQNGCAPAERFVLAKRAIDDAPQGSLLPRLLLLQGLREYERRAFSVPNLVAQIDLLVHLDRRGHLRLLPIERARLIALSQRVGSVSSSFREYHALATALIEREATTPSRR